jgi:hypothetical protein
MVAEIAPCSQWPCRHNRDPPRRAGRTLWQGVVRAGKRKRGVTGAYIRDKIRRLARKKRMQNATPAGDRRVGVRYVDTRR